MMLHNFACPGCGSLSVVYQADSTLPYNCCNCSCQLDAIRLNTKEAERAFRRIYSKVKEQFDPIRKKIDSAQTECFMAVWEESEFKSRHDPEGG